MADPTRKLSSEELRECWEVASAEWKQQPEWDGMARHLVEDIHRGFRNKFEQARKDAKLFSRMCGHLHGHHSLEDSMFFPAVVRAHPSAKEKISLLEQDHVEISLLEQRIENGEEELIGEFVDLLIDHLNREEMIVIPLLLQGPIPMY